MRVHTAVTSLNGNSSKSKWPKSRKKMRKSEALSVWERGGGSIMSEDTLALLCHGTL